MNICSRTTGYCFKEEYTIVFRIVFGNFCNLIISKRSIEIQIFFPDRLWRFLKKWAHLRQVTFKCPPPLPGGIYDKNLLGCKSESISEIFLFSTVINLSTIGQNLLESHDFTIPLQSKANQALG